jgi:hypothetical protein
LFVALVAGAAAAASDPPSPSKVLLVPSGFGSQLQNDLLSLGVPQVDLSNRSNQGPPTLAELQSYDVVVTWTNWPPVDAVGWGDVLADYVDGGGAVVIGTFGWYDPVYDLEGRINDPGYSPFHAVGGNPFSAGSLGAYDASHPIMQGVTSINGSYRDLVGVDPTATVVARWSDGLPFVGINESCNVAGITLFPGNGRRWSGDAPLLYFNAVNTVFSGCGGTVDIDIDIQPGSFPNSINAYAKGKGNVAVAILTTSVTDGDAVDFDATTVDALTVKFGPSETGKAHPRQPLGHIQDVDGDGDLDLLLHFLTSETGVACGDTEATLTGETLGGQAIEGMDSVRIVPCR